MGGIICFIVGLEVSFLIPIPQFDIRHPHNRVLRRLSCNSIHLARNFLSILLQTCSQFSTSVLVMRLLTRRHRPRNSKPSALQRRS